MCYSSLRTEEKVQEKMYFKVSWYFTPLPATAKSTGTEDKEVTIMLMTMPSLFRGNLLDDFFDDNVKNVNHHDMMRADVKELENGYELSMNLPGVKKEDIKAELKNGYITVTATTENSNDEKDNEGNYIRRERFYGSTSRSFYVGEHVKEEDISAKYENGVLTLKVPKKDAKQIEDEKKYIAIEG